MIHWEDVDQVRFRVHTVVPHPQPQLTPRNLCLYLFETHVLMSLMSGPQPAALLAFRSPAKAALALWAATLWVYTVRLGGRAAERDPF